MMHCWQLSYFAERQTLDKIPRTQTAAHLLRETIKRTSRDTGYFLLLFLLLEHSSIETLSRGIAVFTYLQKGENDDKAGVDTVRVLQQLGEVVVRHTGDEALSGSPSSRQDPPPPPSSLPPQPISSL